MGDVRIPFPLKGKDENWAASGQPPLTSPDLQNVRPRDIQDKRSRGGQRPGMRKVMYWWDYPGEGADLGLPYSSPIIGLAQVTAVYYASMAGEGGVDYIDPTGGDPKWDGIVLLMEDDVNHEVQVYSFTGDSILEIDLNELTMAQGGIALDSYGNIYVNGLGTIFKYSRDGTLLMSYNYAFPGGSYIDAIVPSNRDDDVVFLWNKNYIRAVPTSTLDIIDDELWETSHASTTIEIIQLTNSDDIILPSPAYTGYAAYRFNRITGVRTTIAPIVDTADSIAVDEENDWIYFGGGDGGVATAPYTVRRHVLSTGDLDASIAIPGADIKKIIFHNNELYVAGTRATDNNTIWKFDAALVGIEASYDTGNTVRDMRILDNGTVYAVGINGTNEDAETGNVNVLTSALVHSDTWNVRAGKNILRIADKD